MRDTAQELVISTVGYGLDGKHILSKTHAENLICLFARVAGLSVDAMRQRLAESWDAMIAEENNEEHD